MKETRTNKDAQIRIDDSNDAGSWSGYANVKYVLDSHGTLMLDGCYLKGLPSFLLNNCAPDTHGVSDSLTPTYQNILGFYVSAVEDEIGLWVEGKFHSDEKSQRARQKMTERQAAGLSNGMSIGFEIPEGTDIWVYQKDYATELPKYIPANKLASVLAQVDNMPCVRLLTEVIVTEVSPTVIPSNTASVIEEVRFRKTEHNYNITDINENENNMSELRLAKRLGKDTYDKLSAHLDKLDDAVSEHRKGLEDSMEEHRAHLKRAKELSKSMSEMRDTLDNLHNAKDKEQEEDDMKDAKEPDGDEKEKRSLNDVYRLLEEINNKSKS